jgi:hypothetical protein
MRAAVQTSAEVAQEPTTATPYDAQDSDAVLTKGSFAEAEYEQPGVDTCQPDAEVESNASTVSNIPSGEQSADGSSDSGGEECLEASEEQPGTGSRFSTEGSLIIFDWDDTLFPTSMLLKEGLGAGGCVSLSENVTAQVQSVATSAAALLRTARLQGQVIIVTNAAQGWVEWCCEHIVPELALALAGVRVVSARSAFAEPLGLLATPWEWKKLAFEHEIRAFCEERASCSERLQVVSIGDSMHEHEALWNAWKVVSGFCPKTVQLLVGPTSEKLVCQHELLLEGLADISEHAVELDYEVALD